MPIERTAAGALAVLTLARPKVNAFDTAFLEETARAFDDAARDPAVRGIVLAARGASFSAGLDLVHVASLSAAGVRRLLEALDRALESMLGCPKPVAAAVGGHAIAGGLVLPLAADFLALGDGPHRLGLTEVAVGVPFPPLPFEVCRLRLAPRALSRLVLDATLLGPREAHDLGVGDALVPDPVAAATAWLERTSAYPLETFAETKRALVAPALERWRAAPPTWKDRFAAAVASEPARRAIEAALRR